jgi:hypothetical protein
VDVVVGHVRDVEVDDVGEGLDVDAARRDVGGDEDAVTALLESRQGLRALGLGAVAVDPLAGHALLEQRLGEAVGAVLGARKDEDVLDVAALEQLEQQRGLEVLGNRIDRLRDADGGGGLALLVDREGILQHLARELGDRRRHRRREEERLAFDGQVSQHFPDVREKAHVEHAVRFVEHQHLEVVELCIREAEVVEQASGCGDQDVRAGPERVLLRSHGHAAENGGRGESRVHRELAGVLLDLGSQLAGRRQDESPRHATLLADQAVKDRQQEGGGLTAARHGAGEHVAPFHGGRDRVVLDGRGPRESHLFDAAQEIRMETELRERQENPPRGKKSGRFFLGNGGFAGEAYVRGCGRPGGRPRTPGECHRPPQNANRGVRSEIFGFSFARLRRNQT